MRVTQFAYIGLQHWQGGSNTIANFTAHLRLPDGEAGINMYKIHAY
jgi:hypothetical protein